MKTDDVFAVLDSGLPIPEEVAQRGTALKALQGLTVPGPAPKPPTVREVEREVVTDTVIAAEKGKAVLPDGARLTKAAAAIEAWKQAEIERLRTKDLHKAVLSEAMANLVSAMVDHHAEFIAGLHAELDSLMVELRQLAPLVKGFSTDTVIRAAEEVREAWIRIDVLAAKHIVIRNGQAWVAEAIGVQRDEAGYFTMFRNVNEVWPGVTKRQFASKPWPTDNTRSFLLWLAEHPEYEHWVPTPAQRDARHLEVYGKPVAGSMRRDLEHAF